MRHRTGDTGQETPNRRHRTGDTEQETLELDIESYTLDTRQWKLDTGH